VSILMASDYVFFDFVSILHDVVGLLLFFFSDFVALPVVHFDEEFLVNFGLV